MWLMVFGTTVGLEHVCPEYQPFDRVTSSSIRLTVVNLRTKKLYNVTVKFASHFKALSKIL